MHPHRHLLVLVTREEPDVTAQGHDRPCREQFVEVLLLDHLLKSGGKSEQGLSGTGRSDQGDDLDVVVEKQIKRHGLLHVACDDSIDGFSGPGHGDHMTGVGQNPSESGVRLIVPVTQHDELVWKDIKPVQVGTRRVAKGQSLQLGQTQLSLFVEFFDHRSIDVDLDVAPVQPVHIHSAGLEVLARDFECITLDPGVDVLGDEERGLSCGVQCVRDAQNPVVGDVQIQRDVQGPITTVDSNDTTGLVPAHPLEETPLFTKPIE